MTEFNEYPKHMTHPQYHPGSIGVEKTGAGGFKYWEGGTSVKFPPVLVHNQDDEEFHKAKGYISDAKSDINAFNRAHAVAASHTNYVPQEYPKWVGNVLVDNADEELAALEGPKPAPEPMASPVDELAELRRQLAEKQAMIDALEAGRAAGEADAEAEDAAKPRRGRPPRARTDEDAA